MLGNGQWAVVIKKNQEHNARSNIIPSMPDAPCPMPQYLRRINWQSEMEPCSSGRGRIYPNLTVVCADDALAQR
jgi:hypothetical protein